MFVICKASFVHQNLLLFISRHSKLHKHLLQALLLHGNNLIS